ncbi:hypothetical protein ACS0TY_032017 [Phlomoides rotata]
MENEDYGMGLSRSTSFGRKRVALLSSRMDFDGNHDECVTPTPLKRRRSQDSFEFGGKSALEDLPQEILIKILCGVEHDDLKKLLFVSKSIKEATLVSKESHFAFSTPKKTVGFQNFDFFNDSIEIEAPNAPKQSRVPRRRLSPKKLTDISVALFS